MASPTTPVFQRQLTLLLMLLLPHLFLVDAVGARQCFWPIPTPEEAGCLSWRVMVEANNARGWRTVPPQCVGYVRGYMTRGQYLRDLAGVMEQASAYVEEVAAAVGDDGLDAWVLDVDDTCLSNLFYYETKQFGAYDPSAFKDWASRRACPGIPPVLQLFTTLLDKGFKVFLLSGRDEETLGACTAENLEAEGFSGYERLIMRTPEYRGQSSSLFKSAMRKQLVEEGYRIRGNVGDQWTDLQGDCVGDRGFKIPNPMYFAEEEQVKTRTPSPRIHSQPTTIGPNPKQPPPRRRRQASRPAQTQAPAIGHRAPRGRGAPEPSRTFLGLPVRSGLYIHHLASPPSRSGRNLKGSRTQHLTTCHVQLFLDRHGQEAVALLPADQEQAVPEVALLPGRAGPEDPHLRRGPEAPRRGRVPAVRAPGELGEGERVKRGAGGGPDRVQQVHGQARGEGRLPPPRPGAPVPRPPHQQDALLRRRRPAADRDARRVREAHGDVRAGQHRAGAALRAVPRRARGAGARGAAQGQVQVPRPTEDHHQRQVGVHQVLARGVPQAQERGARRPGRVQRQAAHLARVAG